MKDLESHGLKSIVKLKRCAFLIICSDSNRVKVNDRLSNYVFGELKRHIDSLLKECIYGLVLENQLSPEIVNLLFTVTNQNIKLTVLREIDVDVVAEGGGLPERRRRHNLSQRAKVNSPTRPST